MNGLHDIALNDAVPCKSHLGNMPLELFVDMAADCLAAKDVLSLKTASKGFNQMITRNQDYITRKIVQREIARLKDEIYNKYAPLETLCDNDDDDDDHEAMDAPDDDIAMPDFDDMDNDIDLTDIDMTDNVDMQNDIDLRIFTPLPYRYRQKIDLPDKIGTNFLVLATTSVRANVIRRYLEDVDGGDMVAWAALLEETEVLWY